MCFRGYRVKRLAVVRSLLVVAAIVSTPAAALAQQQQYGQPPNTYVTWGNNNQSGVDVTYFIDAGFNSAQANLIRQAAAAWNTTNSNINLVEAGAGANIEFNYVPIAGFVLSTMNMTTAAGPGTYPNGDPWAQIQNPVTFDVNSNAPWYDGTNAIAGNIDFGAYAVTLMGRAIGLGTAGAGDLPSVMRPDSAFGFGSLGLTSPSASDVAAVNAVYGTPEPATFALFAVGLAAFGFSKRLRRK